ncbi:MAG: permease [Firmicutes bacterium HGW-Firmicutes-7]|nr:MAG: permease [Firmicutes bacterium HGW-Firmicutes-7]
MTNLTQKLDGFTIIFTSIILEAIPFVLIGAIVSSFIQLFVSEKTIQSLLPKNKYVAIIGASFMGIIFPVCECAIIPIMRRLVKKGVPLDVAITFMLSVPILNPIVLLSTYYAFTGQPSMVLYRGILGAFGAIIIGLIVGRLNHRNVLKISATNFEPSCCTNHNHEEHLDQEEHHHECTQDTVHIRIGVNQTKRKILSSIIDHTSHEFFEVGRFLIIGAFLSALMQTLLPRTTLMAIGKGPINSIIVLMLLAFVLSICSEADAFIARTFVGQFTQGSIVAFLIFGPMLDIKNMIMLSATFKAKFLLKLVTVITIVCFLLALMVNIIIG